MTLTPNWNTTGGCGSTPPDRPQGLAPRHAVGPSRERRSNGPMSRSALVQILEEALALGRSMHPPIATNESNGAGATRCHHSESHR